MDVRDMLTPRGTEAAIARVLEAELAAQASVEAAANRSAVSVAAARDHARLILATADQRIVAIRQAVATRIASHQAGVDATIRRLRNDATSADTDPERFARALDAVAAALTSSEQP